MQGIQKLTRGFTLIELLVVIVIIGILSVGAMTTFNQFFGQAEDAALETTISNTALVVTGDAIRRPLNEKYDYEDAGGSEDTGRELADVLTENGISLNDSQDTVCYGFVAGSAGTPAEFAIYAPNSEDDVMFVAGTQGGINIVNSTYSTAEEIEDFENCEIDAFDGTFNIQTLY